MTDMEAITRLVLLLDAAIPALENEAKSEQRREAGKPWRRITAHVRATAARELVNEVAQKYGFDLA